MKNSSLAIFFSFISALSVNAQNLLLEAENSNNQVRQKIGTENVLREYFSSVPSVEDTLYVALYRPALCPRCEEGIKALNEAMHNEGKKVVLISVLSDSVLSNNYAKQKGFNADYSIYDNEKKYLEWLNFNTGDLFDVYFLKVCRSSGRLITGVNFFYGTPLFFNQLLAREQPMEMFDFFTTASSIKNDAIAAKPPTELKPLKIKKIYDLDTAGKQLNAIYGTPSINDKYMVLTDEFEESTLVFEKNKSNYVFKYEIVPTDEEKKRFITVSDDIYKELHNEGSIYYFPLSPHFVGNDTLAVSFSLPLVWFDSSEPSAATRVGLANAPAILQRRLSTGEALDAIDIIETDDKYYLSHFDFSLLNNMLILQNEKKTWPLVGDTLKFKHQKCCDPFMKEFYDNDDNFTQAAIDINTGKVVKRFGNLDLFQKNSLTGSYFSSSVYSVSNNQLIYGNGYSGNLYLTDYEHLGEILDTFEIFRIDQESLPNPDNSLLYTYEHASLYNDFFSRKITNVEFTDNNIYCLVAYVDNRSTEIKANIDNVFVIYDRKLKTRKEYMIPRLSGIPLGYGLRKSKTQVDVIAVYKEADYYKLCVLSL